MATTPNHSIDNIKPTKIPIFRMDFIFEANTLTITIHREQPYSRYFGATNLDESIDCQCSFNQTISVKKKNKKELVNIGRIKKY